MKDTTQTQALTIANKQGWDIVRGAFDFRAVDTAQKAVNAFNLIGTLDEISKYNACKIAQMFYKNVEWRNYQGKTLSYDSYMLKAFGIKKQLAYNMNSVAYLIDNDGISLVELLTGIKVNYSYLLELATYLKRAKTESELEFTDRASSLIIELDIKDSRIDSLKTKLKTRKDRLSGKDLTEQVQEQPKVEQPKAEQPKVEQPKAEQPKAEQPKAEQPKAEQPKAEQKEKDANQILDNCSNYVNNYGFDDLEMLLKNITKKFKEKLS